MSVKLLEAHGFQIVRDGPERRVMLSAEVLGDYRAIGEATDRFNVSRRRSLDRLFKHCCEVAKPNNNREHFVKEGNFGPGNEAVWAFKVHQFRVYGASFKVDDKETFIGVRHDPSKKQNRADQSLLKASGTALSEVRALLSKAGATQKAGK